MRTTLCRFPRIMQVRTNGGALLHSMHPSYESRPSSFARKAWPTCPKLVWTSVLATTIILAYATTAPYLSSSGTMWFATSRALEAKPLVVTTSVGVQTTHAHARQFEVSHGRPQVSFEPPQDATQPRSTTLHGPSRLAMRMPTALLPEVSVGSGDAYWAYPLFAMVLSALAIAACRIFRIYPSNPPSVALAALTSQRRAMALHVAVEEPPVDFSRRLPIEGRRPSPTRP